MPGTPDYSGRYVDMSGKIRSYDSERGTGKTHAIYTDNGVMVGYTKRYADGGWIAIPMVNTPQAFPHGESWTCYGFRTYHDAVKFMLQASGLMDTVSGMRARTDDDYAEIADSAIRNLEEQLAQIEARIAYIKERTKNL